MDIKNREIGKILGFLVIETTSIMDNQQIKRHYYICNEEGDVYSAHFDNPETPLNILRMIESQIQY